MMTGTQTMTDAEAAEIAQGVTAQRVESAYNAYVDAIYRVNRMPVSTPMARDAYLRADRELDGMRAMLLMLGFTDEQLDIEPDDDGGFDMSRPTDRLLAAFDAHGVSCGTPDEGGWVDDNVEPIYKALIAAGWTPPTT